LVLFFKKEQERERFFFEKKKQKTFANKGSDEGVERDTDGRRGGSATRRGWQGCGHL
jgi:hypothetical protein